MSMSAHFYAGMHWSSLPVLALLLFLTVFVVAIVRVSLPSRRREIDAAARLPFDEREHERRSER